MHADGGQLCQKSSDAHVNADTPYFSGYVEALCPPDTIYDAIIGNIPGARTADHPDRPGRKLVLSPPAHKYGEGTTSGH